MKTIVSYPRIVLLALALGTAGITATFAQTTTTDTPGEGKHHHESVLTAAEKAELKKAHDQVLASNPALKTEEENLKKQHDTLKGQGAAVSEADKKALHEQMHAFHEKMHAAMLSVDPSLAPIFAKLQAAHKDGSHSK